MGDGSPITCKHGIVGIVNCWPCSKKQIHDSSVKSYAKNKHKYSARKKRYYQQNKEHILAYSKEWYLKNKERHNKKHHKWYKNHREARILQTADYRKKHIVEHRKSDAVYRRKLRLKIKLYVFELLGNKCAKCGFSDIRALQLDHIKGGGVQHLKQLLIGHDRDYYYRYVYDNLNKFQILCANCNWIKRIENGEYKKATVFYKSKRPTTWGVLTRRHGLSINE